MSSLPVPQPEGFACLVRDGGGVARVTATGELDMATAPLLDDALTRAEQRATTVMLDLTKVEFIDCSGVQALLKAERRAYARDGLFLLGGVSAVVTRLLVLTDLNDHFRRVDAATARSHPDLRLVPKPSFPK